VRASRIQDLAAPAEILLDRATVDTLRDRWPVDPRGSVRLRGHTDEVPVFALRGDGPRAVNHGRPGRLIGRQAELERLRTVLGEVADRGRGTAVIVRGEAGIGKTRLLSELEASARDAGFAWTWTENVSFGMEEPYRFARVFAQAIAEEHGTDSGSMSRRLLFQPDVELPDQRRMAGAIAAMARDAAFSGWEAEARWAPADPAELGATLRLVARRYVDRMIAEFGPRVVVIDDLQWIDRSSTGQLEELIAAARRLPLLVLATARPEPLPAWVDADDLDWISVEGLDAGETAELAAEVAGAALTPGDARILHGRTGGNPLFVSEIVRILLEDGALEEREGRLALNTSNTTETVPVTLRAVLGARIDALAEHEREALRAASLIGDTFSDETVGELIDAHRVKGAFSRLAEAALVSPLDAGTWRFAHALIREAAYAGMLASRRRELHALVAEVLQRDSRTPPIALARHRIAAGQNELAVVHLVHAADEAQAVGALDEAVLALREAADLTGDADAGNRLRRRADRISRAQSR
jgi:predicted ATPase